MRIEKIEPRVKIVHTSSYLPSTIVRNTEFLGKNYVLFDENLNPKKGEDELIKIIIENIDSENDSVFDLTGVKTRRKTSENENSEYMALQALKNGLNEYAKGFPEVIGVASVTQNKLFQRFPSHAVEEQLRAGLENVCYAIDVAMPRNGTDLALKIGAVLEEAASVQQQEEGYTIILGTNTISHLKQNISRIKSVFSDVYLLSPGRSRMYGDHAYGAIVKLKKNKQNYKVVAEIGKPEMDKTIEERKFIDEESYFNEGKNWIESLLDKANISKEKINALVHYNINPSNQPNNETISSILEENLGFRAKEGFDISNACAADPALKTIMNGLAIWYDGLKATLSVENLSRIGHPESANYKLWGDGASMAFLENSYDGTGIIASYGKSNPFGGRNKWIIFNQDGYLLMPEGNLVLKAAIREMLDASHVLNEIAGLSDEEKMLMAVIPHQANGRITTGIKKRKERSVGKICETIEHTGNMSTVTTPYTYDLERRAGTFANMIFQNDIALGGGVVVAGYLHKSR